MKKLSDYHGEDAIDLWADLIDIGSNIFADPKIIEMARSGVAKITLAKEMIKLHKKEVSDILLRIDDEPIDGLNVILRLVAILNEIGEHPELKDFFDMPSQTTTEESSGSVMENTGASER